MRKFIPAPFVNILFLLFITTTSAAQSARENELRKIDNEEREAVLKADTVALFTRLWSPTMVVNTPASRVNNVEGTKAHVRAGMLNYSVFDRKVEKITINDNVGIVMGEEVITPKGKAQNAGKKVTRRFTNIWQFANRRWVMIGRQATVIKIE